MVFLIVEIRFYSIIISMRRALHLYSQRQHTNHYNVVSPHIILIQIIRKLRNGLLQRRRQIE